ncbi:MAG: pyruvate, phosphate dikinase [Oscillospiraceae bacterium]|nr:pyruvate, phosphate dikinase [Oscillospiraceae bacterium]
MAYKYVHLFSEGNGKMTSILGGKGANLAEMISLGMPVPHGFTVSTEACIQYYEGNKTISEDIVSQIKNNVRSLESTSGKKLGDYNNPLLLSVRSGARASMPGMMDTILNLGLTGACCESLAKITNNPHFAYDSYKRFIQMFADIVMGVPKHKFEEILSESKKEKSASLDTNFTAENLKEIIIKFKKLYKEETGSDFPEDPYYQLMEAIKAVFRSWDNPRANIYRRMNGIPYSWGTAVNVQIMVFGNLGENSGTGVAFSRNPSTGENELFGEYLMNAQGEDIVAGVRTPQPISHLKEAMPEVYEEFYKYAKKLEDHYTDMQDIEFTIESGKLYILQTRNGKRTAKAALKIAIDLVKEKKITEEEAILRVDPQQLDSLLHPQFNPETLKKSSSIGKGLAASPGAACGRVVFTAENAKLQNKNGEKIILVRNETSPEDIEGMLSSEGILTVMGGMTSHAAVVARGMGICCVSGCSEMKIEYKEKHFTLSNTKINEGDYISIDGSTGYIYTGKIETVPPEISGDFETLMGWADKYRRLEIRANADTPKDVAQSIKYGAQGVGLCRTEHMFFEDQKIKIIREMIVSKTENERKHALDRLFPLQKKDFKGMFIELKSLPMTIRLLDPPLHEFLPSEEEDIAEIAHEMMISTEELKSIIENLHEVNPMMGHRGCRLAVSYPEIAKMQTRAIIEAAIEVKKLNPEYDIVPEIMVPLVGDEKELKFVKNIVRQTADEIISDNNTNLIYKIGTMIEVPRAAVTADKIAQEAEFFSFGTNDLTQMTFGFSRDDISKFINAYYDRKIYEADPFKHIDEAGVGNLINLACNLGRKTNPNLKIGVCGEHGADPASIKFFDELGLNYVSCSPFRVPVARLAAAQSAVKLNKNNICAYLK